MTKPKILIGDDQLDDSAQGRDLRTLFELVYRQQLQPFELAYTADPERFVELASSGEYHVLMIDLRWGSDLPTEGYSILDKVREYAPVRVLWTSESEEARMKGYEHGATHCIGKRPAPEELEQILSG
ncbi:hypothetical protein HZC30_01040 [Candidatus Woesearchaeota archaeon]|nr:hypothetical protein [Candidatus Woesearchaeota archaeon]